LDGVAAGNQLPLGQPLRQCVPCGSVEFFGHGVLLCLRACEASG